MDHGAKIEAINMDNKTPFQLADAAWLKEITFDMRTLTLKDKV